MMSWRSVLVLEGRDGPHIRFGCVRLKGIILGDRWSAKQNSKAVNVVLRVKGHDPFRTFNEHKMCRFTLHISIRKGEFIVYAVQERRGFPRSSSVWVVRLAGCILVREPARKDPGCEKHRSKSSRQWRVLVLELARWSWHDPAQSVSSTS